MPMSLAISFHAPLSRVQTIAARPFLWYAKVLHRFPNTTNLITGANIAMFSDLSAQWIENAGTNKKIDNTRMLYKGLVSFFVFTPMNIAWIRRLERVMGPTGKCNKTLMKKVFLDGAVFGPAAVFAYFGSLGLLECGLDSKKAMAHAGPLLYPGLQSYSAFKFAANIYLFRFITPAYIVPASAVFNYFFNFYMSLMNSGNLATVVGSGADRMRHGGPVQGPVSLNERLAVQPCL